MGRVKIAAAAQLAGIQAGCWDPNWDPLHPIHSPAAVLPASLPVLIMECQVLSFTRYNRATIVL